MRKLALLLGGLASVALIYLSYPLVMNGRVHKPIAVEVKPVEIPAVAVDRGAKIFNSDVAIAAPILAMREKLLVAAQSGNITRLKIVFETNEMMPAFASSPERDPVPYWRKRSGDGEGREILSALANILALPAARINEGKPSEMVIYPYLAGISLGNLTPEQKVDMLRLLSPDEAKAMTQFGSYIYWRVGIGKDGTLHYFKDGK